MFVVSTIYNQTVKTYFFVCYYKYQFLILNMYLFCRNQLDVATLEVQHETSTTGHALRAYEAVGSGFDDLVRDFTKLREELENKKWAIRELKNTPDKD